MYNYEMFYNRTGQFSFPTLWNRGSLYRIDFHRYLCVLMCVNPYINFYNKRMTITRYTQLCNTLSVYYLLLSYTDWQTSTTVRQY